MEYQTGFNLLVLYGIFSGIMMVMECPENRVSKKPLAHIALELLLTAETVPLHWLG
jgi:hypothetical protein